MPSEIVLLTGELEAVHLRNILFSVAPDLPVAAASTRDELISICETPLPGRRLIGFCTDVIVPSAVLAGLGGPAYNFHPGPPEYPGSQVACFAVYEGATAFGVTLHEMAPVVDSGAIVAVRRFPVEPGSKFMDVEMQSYRTMLDLFGDLATYFATDDRPLPPTGDAWSGPVRTKAQADAFREVEADMSEEEIVRRYRAFG